MNLPESIESHGRRAEMLVADRAIAYSRRSQEQRPSAAGLAVGPARGATNRAERNVKTRKRAHRMILGLGVIVSAAAGAAEFDGSAPLSCTGVSAYSCEPGKACSKVKPESNTAPVVLIDLPNKTVKSPFRTDLLPIANSAINNEQLQLQGTSEKFAWSAVVNRGTGKLTITIADRMGAYVIFGQCKAAGTPSQ